MSKKVQYQRKEALSQSSDSEDPLQLRRSLDSLSNEDEDSAPANNRQKGNASKNSQLSKNTNDAVDNSSRPKRTRSRRRRSQKGNQQAVVAANVQAQTKVEQQSTTKADQQKRKASDTKPTKPAKETLNTTQPARDTSPSSTAHARRSSRDKADPKARSQPRGQRNDKPVKFVPKQQKPVDVDVPKPVSVAETKTSQLEALHGGQVDVRQAPDERTAPQSPSSEQQLSPVFVTPVSPNQYVEHQMPMHPMYMPPTGYAYVPPGYYYPFVPQPMPYYYYPPAEYYPMQAQHGAYIDARGQVYYDLEPQLMQQQIRQHLFGQQTQVVDDKENIENTVEQPVAHAEQKFVEVIKIHEAPKPEQAPIEPAPAATEATENTQPLSTERVRSNSNTALKPRSAPKTKKAPVWVPKSTVKTTVTPANVS